MAGELESFQDIEAAEGELDLNKLSRELFSN